MPAVEQSKSELENPASSIVVDVRGITKSFGPSRVLSGVNLEMRAGEVIALAGENGAGKSTLLKIIAGMVSADGGELFIDNRPVGRHDVRDAHVAGIAIIPQELAPVPDLTVYENIFLGRELTMRSGSLNRRAMIHEAARLLDEFGLTVDPRTRMRSVSTATQQLVEIVKNTSTGCRVLLLDEPTSAISGTEANFLFDAMAELRTRGVTMIYTTHKMSEIRSVANRVVILRDGALIVSKPVSDITDEEIIEAMIGRELGGLYPTLPEPELAHPVLEVEDLVVTPGGPAISFTVARGQFVALAGLMGAGRTELIETLFGVRRPVSGTVRVDGKEIRRSRPSSSIRAGMALVPEDRKVGGAVLGMSILDNALMPRLSKFSHLGWLKKDVARRAIGKAMSSVHLKATSLSQIVDQLSGGNQQKLVIGRWLTDEISLLLLDEPTRGVDVGARGEIYRLVAELARDNQLAVLFASSDMPEVIGLAHKILIMRGGAIVEEIDVSDHTDSELQARIFRASAGVDEKV